MWQWYAVVAMVCFAAMQLVFKQLTQRGFSSPSMLVVVFALGALCYVVHLAVTRTAPPTDPGAIALLALTAVLAYVGNYYSVRAVATAPNPGYSLAIVGLQGVVVTLVAVVLFGSALSWTKMVGVVLCCVGLALVLL